MKNRMDHEASEHEPQLDTLEQMSNFSTDHSFITVYCLGCGHSFRVPEPCGNRFCSVCTRGRRMRVRRKLDALLHQVKPKRGYQVRFVTLTIPTGPDLKQSVDTLLSSFRRLRQRMWWKSKVMGGGAVIEITVSHGLYHAHLHMLVESLYLPKMDLSKMWHRVSPGFIVDVRSIRGNVTASYLTKYITKDAVPVELQLIMSDALKGRRLYFPFGSWHAIERELPKDRPHCPDCHGTQFLVWDFEKDHFLTGAYLPPGLPPPASIGTTRTACDKPYNPTLF